METVSAFDIVKIGIGPSSSHTMGPWRAAGIFIQYLKEVGYFERTVKVKVLLFGSLAKTGKGHGTDVAVMLGLSGETIEGIDTSEIKSKIDTIKQEEKLLLAGVKPIDFDPKEHIVFNHRRSLPFHPNGMALVARLSGGRRIRKTFFSVGGGFVVQKDDKKVIRKDAALPFLTASAKDIVHHCQREQLSIAKLVFENEKSWKTEKQIEERSKQIWETIKDCVFKGCHTEGILPGGLNVVRRATKLNRKMLEQYSEDRDQWLNAIKEGDFSFAQVLKWVSCFALAVNEENAAFGRIVTAPTNGAAGVIPAVMLYAYCFTEDFNDEKVMDFILCAGEIGGLFKKNATISAALGGCQAEIGVSSAMAAAALAQALGGTVEQNLMAAEIAMEHHLGMTCDPIAGLVQIPCIERNSMGAIKAITAANIAMESDPNTARVSLDEVIKPMWQTALDMNKKYKETAEAGLATNIPVNVAEC